MAAGAISNTSTDAINGSQLYTISDSVAKRLGGGATVGSDGTVTAVSYALRSGTYNNVGDALSGIDNNTLQWNKTAGRSAPITVQMPPTKSLMLLKVRFLQPAPM